MQLPRTLIKSPLGTGSICSNDSSILSTFSHSCSEALLCNFCFPWTIFQHISVQKNDQVFEVTVSINLNNMKVYRRVPLAKEHLYSVVFCFVLI